MRLLVASDEPVVRRGFRDILAARQGWSVATEVAAAEELPEAIRRNGTDVAVLVLPLGEHGGIELVEQIRAHSPLLPVIVVAAFSAEQYAISFFRAGANAFLRRSAEADEILAALDAVAGGGKYVAPTLAIDMARPAFYRIGYNAGTAEF